MEAILMMLSRKNVVFIFGMAAMPFLCSGIWFSPKLSHHRIISLAVFLPRLIIYFYQETNLHLYKWASVLQTISFGLRPNQYFI